MKILCLFFIILFSCRGFASEQIKQQVIQALSQKNGNLLSSLFSRTLLADIRGDQIIVLLNQKELLYGPIEKFIPGITKGSTYNFDIVFQTGVVPFTFTVKDQKIDDVDLGYFLPKRKEDIVVSGKRGVALQTKIGKPVGRKSPRAVVLMLHDNGPIDYNGNSMLNSTRKEQDGIFYRFSREFRRKGFATVRYNKRTAVINYLETSGHSTDSLHKLTSIFRDLIADVKLQLTNIKKMFPGVPILLLGVGEGAQIALQVANKEYSVKGVLLVGFSTIPSILNAYREFVYQPHDLFRLMDKNKDGVLTYSEMDKGLISVDLNGDNQVTLSEYNTVNLRQFYTVAYGEEALREKALEQLALPQPLNLLKSSWYKIMFIQGEWDRISPISLVRSVELENAKWKKANLKFIYEPRLGHELNPKRSFIDDSFVPSTIENYTKWVKEFIQFL